MRFCIVTPFFPSNEKSGGGVGTHYHDLARYLAPLCEEILLVYIADRPMDKEVKQSLPDNVTVENIEDGFGNIQGNPYSLLTKIRKRFSRLILNIKIAFRLLALDREKRIDVIETTNYLYLCLFYTFLPNRRPLITRFSSSTGQLRRYGKWRSSKWDLIEQLEIWMFKRSHVKLTHTYQHGRSIADQMHIPFRSIQIIPHGTSISKGHEVATQQDNKTAVTVLFLGRLELRKGIFTLLGALPSLLDACPELQIRIAGEDPENLYEQVFLKEMSAYANQVTFLGEISHDEKVREYKHCDIFAAPSLYESFGLIYVEAMSFGKPAIGCRAGGAIEVINDQEDGYLIEPGSSEELADTILTLANNADLRYRMGKAAKQRVENFFTAEIMAANSLGALDAIRAEWNYRL